MYDPKREHVVTSISYIFDGAGGMRDQLEQTILKELELKEYPLPAQVTNVKSGNILFGTTEQCVTIEVTKKKFAVPMLPERIVIANTTVGTYLYVQIYLLVPELNLQNAQTLQAFTSDDFFKAHQKNAAFTAAVAATEAAFDKLQLKQLNCGYRQIPNNMNSKDSH